jgi:hypothetical protein
MFSLDLTRGDVQVHWTNSLTCASRALCFNAQLFYDATGTGHDEAGQTRSISGSQTSVQVLGNKIIDEWSTDHARVAPVGENTSRTLSEAANGPWASIAVLSSEPSNFSLLVNPASSLHDLAWGKDGVHTLFAHDFDAAADVRVGIQQPVVGGAGPNVGGGGGASFSAGIATTRGFVGLFDPWFTGALYHTGRAASWQGPDNEGGSCIDKGPLGGCGAFVFHGGPGTRSLSAVQRVADGAVDEAWVFYVDAPPPAIPPP